MDINDLIDSLGGYANRAGALGQSLYEQPGATLADMLRGVGNGVVQSPFDFAEMVSPATSPTGMVEPIIKALYPDPPGTLSPAEEVKQWLATTPLSVTNDAGAVGRQIGEAIGPPSGDIARFAAMGRNGLNAWLAKALKLPAP